MTTAFAPEGYHTVTPRIFAHDPGRLVDFMRSTFGASGEVHGERPAEVRIGDSLIMVSGADQREPMPAFLYVYVADVDGTYRLALEAGAASQEEPRDVPYGDRRAMVRDAWGNVWQIAARMPETARLRR
jgi:PhnB protein